MRTTEPRTLAPPSRRTAHVTSVEHLGAYHVIRALDSGGPADPQPGQFYMLSTAAPANTVVRSHFNCSVRRA